MIVTIDGPAGAGKSSAARSLAKRLGFEFLDTGSMYRAVTLAAIRDGIVLDDNHAIGRLADGLEIELKNDRVWLNGQDVTREIRTFEITSATRYAADHSGVRSRLVELQREATKDRDFVTEGRDQGTVVFPDADCKIFLTASENLRAERRYHDLIGRGEDVTFEEVLEKQQERDHRDATREVGGLRKAADAIELCTDGMSPEQVVEELLAVVESKRSNQP